MRSLLLVVAILAGSDVARADEAPHPKRKRLLDAYAITVGATAAPVVMFSLMAGDNPEGTVGTVGGVLASAALVVGPSAGHWYAGGGWTTGLSLRLGGAAILGGLVIREQFVSNDLGTMLVGGLVAVGLWETGVVWDLVTLPRAVRRYNRDHARPVIVAPFVTDRSSGVAITGAF